MKYKIVTIEQNQYDSEMTNHLNKETENDGYKLVSSHVVQTGNSYSIVCILEKI